MPMDALLSGTICVTAEVFACCCADLVTPYGYPLEQHNIRTKDGYLLGLFRIPHGVAATNDTERWVCRAVYPIPSLNAAAQPCT